MPNYRFPEAAVRALALAADRRDWLSRPLGQRPVFDDVDAEGAQTIVAAALAELGPGGSTTSAPRRCWPRTGCRCRRPSAARRWTRPSRRRSGSAAPSR